MPQNNSEPMQGKPTEKKRYRFFYSRYDVALDLVQLRGKKQAAVLPLGSSERMMSLLPRRFLSHFEIGS